MTILGYKNGYDKELLLLIKAFVSNNIIDNQ